MERKKTLSILFILGMSTPFIDDKVAAAYAILGTTIIMFVQLGVMSNNGFHFFQNYKHANDEVSGSYKQWSLFALCMVVAVLCGFLIKTLWLAYVL